LNETVFEEEGPLDKGFLMSFLNKFFSVIIDISFYLYCSSRLPLRGGTSIAEANHYLQIAIKSSSSGKPLYTRV
jgi:hypothetical protein